MYFSSKLILFLSRASLLFEKTEPTVPRKRPRSERASFLFFNHGGEAAPPRSGAPSPFIDDDDNGDDVAVAVCAPRLFFISLVSPRSHNVSAAAPSAAADGV